MKVDLKKMAASAKSVICSRGFVMGALLAVICFLPMTAFASGGGSEAGKGAIEGVATTIGNYLPAVKKVIYSIAAVVAIVGTITVFFKMNNDDQDVKKSIMMIVGACIFLVAAAEALPLFFGYK